MLKWILNAFSLLITPDYSALRQCAVYYEDLIIWVIMSFMMSHLSHISGKAPKVLLRLPSWLELDIYPMGEILYLAIIDTDTRDPAINVSSAWHPAGILQMVLGKC